MAKYIFKTNMKVEDREIIARAYIPILTSFKCPVCKHEQEALDGRINGVIIIVDECIEAEFVCPECRLHIFVTAPEGEVVATGIS